MKQIINSIRRVIGYTIITILYLIIIIILPSLLLLTEAPIEIVLLMGVIFFILIKVVKAYVIPSKEEEILSKLPPGMYVESHHLKMENIPITPPRYLSAEEILYKTKSSIASVVKGGIKRKDWELSAEQLLHCDYEFFIKYIESQFTEGMTWFNHGDWHYDHKVPISVALNKEETIKLSHYTNFQPMWAKDNLSKGGKMLDKHIILRNKLIGR